MNEGTRSCELCIVGGGYAALNALNAAADYLSPGARVVVIDRNETWGGQWLRQYDFLRLHQPYQLFTAGDQPWRLGAPREHLASKREVLDHLASVPRVSAGHLQIEPLFRHEYVGHTVRDGAVELEARSLDGARPTRIRAKRLLKAGGLDLTMLPPFPISSSRVRSVGISDPILGTPEFLESDAPIYVIGCGKSAMDLVGHLVRTGHAKGRVRMISGSGMYFFSRDYGYATGANRFFGGTLATDLFLRIVQRFDGSNEREVAHSLEREGAMLSVHGDGNCRYGLLSIAEKEAVLSGLAETHPGHLVDVEGTRMTIRGRDGRMNDVEVAPGSWLVNCTSHFKYVPHEPVLSDGGLVCAPQYGLGFTGTTAYFLTHLWYRDGLGAIADRLRTGRVDVEPKLRFLCEVGVMVLHNMALVAERLPFSVAARFRGDFNKWYPFYRQLPALMRVVAHQKEALAKGERLLPMRFADPPTPV